MLKRASKNSKMYIFVILSKAKNLLDFRKILPPAFAWGQNDNTLKKHTQLYIDNELSGFFTQTSKTFEQLMALQGECFRRQKTRRTSKVNIGGKHYFIKQHFGIGWRELFKNLLQLKIPVLGAVNEWRAIQKLNQLGIATAAVKGYGQKGVIPASRQSFVLMEALEDMVSLEELGKTWQHKKPTYRFKQHLIEAVAMMARRMHEHGINHRDFYLCHFLLKPSNAKLYLIDLHRAQIRAKTPQRWVVKDLAGLYFSSMDIGLTKRDLLRFMKIYRHKPLKEILSNEKDFWRKVKTRGEQLYLKHGG